MTDLELLAEWLLLLRQERLQKAHAYALGGGDIVELKVCHHEAAIADRVYLAVRTLRQEPGRFIKEYLQREPPGENE